MVLGAFHFLDGLVAWIYVALSILLLLFHFLILILVQTFRTKDFVTFVALDDLSLGYELTDLAFQVFDLRYSFKCRFGNLIKTELNGSFNFAHCQVNASDLL